MILTFYCVLLLHSLLSLHNRMVKPLPVPVAALDSLILGCCDSSKVDRAFHAFSQAERVYGVKPQLSTFQALLVVCTHAPSSSFLPAINAVFRQMRSQHVTPTAQTYHIAIATLLNAANARNPNLKMHFLSEVCPRRCRVHSHRGRTHTAPCPPPPPPRAP